LRVSTNSVSTPHLSQERALAEFVPSNPAFSTLKFANAEHQGVSSEAAMGAGRLVDCN